MGPGPAGEPGDDVDTTRCESTVFFTCVASRGQVERARLLIDSIREFGGDMSACPVWVVEADPDGAPCGGLEEDGVTLVPLTPPGEPGDYPFSRKVRACAEVEERAAGSVGTLCWLIPECLVLRPPILFELGTGCDAAVRPVHIRNVGLPAVEEPDAFWSGVFAVAGEPAESFTVESFIEGERIRPYFNSAAFSFSPEPGVMRRWREAFGTLVGDAIFQREACGDELHRIFLHQAILSALVATTLERERIRVLPPDYGYPYNLHGSVPDERRVRALSDTVCPIYEERSVDPGEVDDIEILEPLRSWLLGRTAGRGQ